MRSNASIAGPTFLGIQLLRAVAATAVVIAHVQYDFTHRLSLPGALPDNLVVLSSGVDLFFVISGFVMVYSSDNLFGRSGAMTEFLLRRIARIVPLYWAVTTIMLAYVIARGFASSDASPSLTVASYLFIPWLRPSGEMGPLYGVGWTLNYEMFFYGLFAIALIGRRMIAVGGLIALFIVLAAIHALARPLPLPFDYWFDPLILEFAFGMAVSLAYRAGVRLSPAGAWLLLAAAIAGFAWGATPWRVDFPRWIGSGIPSLLAVAALTLPRTPLRLAGFARLGNASYALYLIHPIIIAGARLLAQHGLLAPAKAPWLYLAGVAGTCIGMSVVTYEYFERPMSRRCRRALFGASHRASQQV